MPLMHLFHPMHPAANESPVDSLETAIKTCSSRNGHSSDGSSHFSSLFQGHLVVRAAFNSENESNMSDLSLHSWDLRFRLRASELRSRARPRLPVCRREDTASTPLTNVFHDLIKKAGRLYFILWSSAALASSDRRREPCRSQAGIS